MNGEQYPLGHPIIYIGHEIKLHAPPPRELLKQKDPEKYVYGKKKKKGAEERLELEREARRVLERDGWWGLIKAKLVPPQELFHPVLPVVNAEGHKKVLFPLCRTCAFTEVSPFSHSHHLNPAT